MSDIDDNGHNVMYNPVEIGSIGHIIHEKHYHEWQIQWNQSKIVLIASLVGYHSKCEETIWKLTAIDTNETKNS